jgi:hypothetical protein
LYVVCVYERWTDDSALCLATVTKLLQFTNEEKTSIKHHRVKK